MKMKTKAKCLFLLIASLALNATVTFHVSCCSAEKASCCDKGDCCKISRLNTNTSIATNNKFLFSDLTLSFSPVILHGTAVHRATIVRNVADPQLASKLNEIKFTRMFITSKDFV
jgi:hypothetical protein